MEWIWGAEVGEELGEKGETGTVIRIHNVRKMSTFYKRNKTCLYFTHMSQF